MESEDKMNSVKEQENREEDKPKQTICCICREEKEKVSWGRVAQLVRALC